MPEQTARCGVYLIIYKKVSANGNQHVPRQIVGDRVLWNNVC